MVDAMLGGLARWLRVLGYDAAYQADIPDGELVRRALEERRIVLTRDRRLPEEWWISDVLLPRSVKPLEQLREVVNAFGLDQSGLFTRCTVCNVPLETSDTNLVSRCPACARSYWEGSHTARMRAALARALD